MDVDRLRSLLDAVRRGDTTIDDALRRLSTLPFESLEFARVDHHRSLRRGFPEVIYCPGKTNDQIVHIAERLLSAGGNLLATRADRAVFDAVAARFPNAAYHEMARAIVVRQREPVWSKTRIGIVSAGTADQWVAEEARVTCEIMDQRVETHYDVGVAGLHRLLASAEAIREAAVVIVVAGMEGALPSVVGGLVSAPVIAVPTSAGYGASLGGIAPLLTMLNSCATGVTLVNIDNGFGAGYTASLINRLASGAAPAG
jgi:NCAIR mutase (PurE)-related protein